MESKAFPTPQVARLPISGPLPARNQPANGISPSVVGGVRRKRGPAGRETTHPLTINFPQRPDSSREQQSNAVTGWVVLEKTRNLFIATDHVLRPTTKVENHGLSFTSSAPLAGEISRP